jgi:RNA polymerase sigma-B factor
LLSVLHNDSTRWDRTQQHRNLEGDRAARDALIERYVPLADSLARRFSGGREPLADLRQVAYLGLIAAVDRWDPERGTTFSTFAVPTILGELRRHFRDRSWLVRPPRDVQERFLAVCKARDRLVQELGREPTARDVAAHLGTTTEDVTEALQAGDLRSAPSLDEPLGRDEDSAGAVLERTADARDDYATADTAIELEQACSVLDRRTREVVRLRYQDDLLQREIAERVGCSQMQVSRILIGAMAALRTAIGHG